jgi:hypothetical protein
MSVSAGVAQAPPEADWDDPHGSSGPLRHSPPQAQLVAQNPHEPQSWTNPPPLVHCSEQGTEQTQTSAQSQVLAQLIVIPLQVTCPLSRIEQSRSAAWQVVPRQLTVEEPPQLAVQRAFTGAFRFAAKMASAGAAGPAAVDGIESTAGEAGASLGVWAKPATAMRARRHAKMVVFMREPPLRCSHSTP